MKLTHFKWLLFNVHIWKIGNWVQDAKHHLLKFFFFFLKLKLKQTSTLVPRYILPFGYTAAHCLQVRFGTGFYVGCPSWSNPSQFFQDCGQHEDWTDLCNLCSWGLLFDHLAVIVRASLGLKFVISRWWGKHLPCCTTQGVFRQHEWGLSIKL